MISAFFNKSVTLKAGVFTQHADGTYSRSVVEGLSLLCSFQPLSASEALKYDRVAGAILATLRIPNRDNDGNALEVALNDLVTIDGQNWKLISPPLPDAYGNGFYVVTAELEQ